MTALLVDRARQVVATAIVGAACAYLVVLGWAMSNTSYDTWGGLIVAPLLVAVAVPFLLRAARRHGDSAKLLVVALAAKLVGALVRFYVAFEVYGSSDASIYDRSARPLAQAFRQGDFSGEIEGIRGGGTRFLQLVAGWVYTFIGPSILAGFLVFAWFSFVGLYLFYRAFRLAMPNGDHRRYALLIFFLPSMVYWPSSIGKDAWMLLALGVIAYGAARLLTHQRGAFVLLGVGLWAAAGVRPHIAALAFGGLALGYLLRRSARTSSVGPWAKGVGLAAMAVAGFLLVSKFEEFFGLDSLDGEGADQILEETADASEKGGSSFTSVRVSSPVDFPLAALTVLFRPLPVEANNAQALLTSLEGVALLIACLRSGSRLRGLHRQLLRNPYLAMAFIYVVGFIVAFSSFSNFGILARQRVQVYPFLLVLLALPVRQPAWHDAKAALR